MACVKCYRRVDSRSGPGCGSNVSTTTVSCWVHDVHCCTFITHHAFEKYSDLSAVRNLPVADDSRARGTVRPNVIRPPCARRGQSEERFTGSFDIGRNGRGEGSDWCNTSDARNPWVNIMQTHAGASNRLAPVLKKYLYDGPGGTYVPLTDPERPTQLTWSYDILVL